MRTSTARVVGGCLAVIVVVLLAACGSDNGDTYEANGGSESFIVQDPSSISPACAASSGDVTVDLCAMHDYRQSVVQAFANGNSVEVYNAPGAGDSLNCPPFNEPCARLVAQGDEFSVVCFEDGYFGVVLPSDYRLDSENYRASLNYWTVSPTRQDGNRFSGVGFILDDGFDDPEAVRAELDAELGSVAGPEVSGFRSCSDPRFVVRTWEVEEHNAG